MCQAEYRAVELTNAASSRIVFAEIQREAGRIDLLVNLAGGTLHKHPIQEFPVSEWRKLSTSISKRLFSAARRFVSRCANANGRDHQHLVEFWHHRRRRTDGLRGGQSRSDCIYEILALEMAPHGVRVNAIAPGLTATVRVRRGYNETEWSRLGEQFPWDGPPIRARSPRAWHFWQARRAVISPDRPCTSTAE